jgi:hypothetical protein
MVAALSEEIQMGCGDKPCPDGSSIIEDASITPPQRTVSFIVRNLDTGLRKRLTYATEDVELIQTMNPRVNYNNGTRIEVILRNGKFFYATNNLSEYIGSDIDILRTVPGRGDQDFIFNQGKIEVQVLNRSTGKFTPKKVSIRGFEIIYSDHDREITIPKHVTKHECSGVHTVGRHNSKILFMANRIADFGQKSIRLQIACIATKLDYY